MTYDTNIVIGASLSKPHIDHDNSPACGIIVGMYVYMYVCI